MKKKKIVKNLEDTKFHVIMDCFLSAFKNYYVKMPKEHAFYKERWRMANVCLNLSYGMFVNDVLVGFIINAIGKRNNKLVAFNTGTGVIPEYRGQRIVNDLYKHAIPELKKNGSTHCRLEVIVENKIAIKAYRSIGFNRIKEYKCFGGEINVETYSNYTLKQVDVHSFNWEKTNQNAYSWDNHMNTIRKGNYNYYVVMRDDTIESYFIANVRNGYVAQFDVLNDARYNWQRLFSAMKITLGTIKINNVDVKLDTKITQLHHFGLKNTVNQYEMEFKL